MRLLKNLSPRFPRLIGLLTLLSFLGASLAGCSTLGTGTVPAAAVEFACDTYGKPLTPSKTKDTAETFRQNMVKNQAFKNIGCAI